MTPTLLEEAKTPEAVAPEEEAFVFPATAAQRRFWLLDQMAPGGNPALNMPMAVRLDGTLDRAALEKSFREVVARHEALRTTFHEEDGQLCQVIAPAVQPSIRLVDAQDFPEAERLLHEEAQTPFDLARGPLCRARLVRIGPTQHLLLLTLHHIVCDGWSNGIILRELGTLYAAFAKGGESPLPPLPLQFADFAEWQTKALADGSLNPQLDYWRKQLAGDLPALELPGAHPRRAGRPEGRSHASPAATRWRAVPAELTRALKALGAREGASGYMVFLAGFYALLNRVAAGQPEDVVVSTPSANRGRAEVEGLVGLFVNPVVLRTSLAGDPTFRQLLGRTRQTVLDAFSNADAPFEWIIEEIKPRRLQVNFIYQPAFLQPVRLPDLTLAPLTSASGGAVFEWTVGAFEEAEGWRLFLEFKADRFNEASIDRTLAQFQTLLEAAAAAPDAPISQLPPSDEETREQAGRAKSLDDGRTQAGAPASGQGAPYLTLHYQLIEIWEDLLGVNPIGIQDDFFALGGNSLLALRMFARIEALCGKTPRPAALFQQADIEHLANELLTSEGAESPPILNIQESGAKTPFFYLHGDLTGGGYYTMKLSRRLGKEQPFYALPPVDVNAVEGLPSIEEMAAMHVTAIRSVRPHGPYIIGGFCLGGLIAYEVAQQLEAAGERVERLVIIDATVDNTRFKRMRRMAEQAGRLRGLDEDKQLQLFCTWHFRWARVKRWRHLGAGEQAKGVLRKFGRAWRRLAGKDEGERPTGILSSTLHKEENGGKAEASSWYDPRWDAPLVFLWAVGGYFARAYQGRTTLLLSSDLVSGPERNPARDWEQCAPNLEVRELPGSHLACITEHVDALGETIQECLNKEDSPEGG
jgi:thioesterase domain-containing protein